MILVIKDSKTGFMNNKGESVIPLKYDYAESFVNRDYIQVRIENKAGVIDRAGKIAVPLEYEWTNNFQFRFGLGALKRNGNYVYVNTEGKEVFEFEFEDTRQFEETGLAICKKAI